MKCFMGLIVAVSVICVTVPVVAETTTPGTKASTGESIFDRMSDWVATLGKSTEQRTNILTDRKTQRTVRRAQSLSLEERGQFLIERARGFLQSEELQTEIGIAKTKLETPDLQPYVQQARQIAQNAQTH